jgi:hypothetical protein
MNNAPSDKVKWPEGKTFAFSVFDDTDRSTLENGRPVYSFLRDCGLRTTKSVWPLGGTEAPEIAGGTTCADADYLKWLLELQKEGFEIGFHNVTYHSSKRAATIRGLDRFREMFGHDPLTMANHTICREGIYWGEGRVSGSRKLIYKLLTLNRSQGWFRGHVEGDEYFWGDLCKARIQYVRNFVFSEINTLKACPLMPYHDPSRPFVNAWFASAEGGEADSFNRTICETNQDQLEAEGGACIMYTHFGKNFYRNGELNKDFKSLIERLSKKNGWFVPVSTLLDYLAKTKGVHQLTPTEQGALERKWLWHKTFVGTT